MLHKRFDFSQLGGFPFSQNTLEFMQEGVSDLSEVIVKIVGNNKIVTGLEIVQEGTNRIRTAGFITVNNELIPFVAGDESIQQFTIKENIESLLFESGESKGVKFSKYAEAVENGEYSFSSLQKISMLNFTTPYEYNDLNVDDHGIVASGLHVEVVRIDANHVRVDGYLLATETSLFGSGLNINLLGFPYDFEGNSKELIGTRISSEGTIASQRFYCSTSYFDPKSIRVHRAGRSIMSPNTNKCYVPIHGIFEIQ